MDEDRTWREFLGKLISDTHERQRIAELIHINPITLQRWAHGGSTPRQDNIRPLLDALSPQQRQQFVNLLKQDFPGFLDHDKTEAQDSREIPATFYAQVLSTFTSSPLALRESTLSTMILQQIIQHLNEQQHGILVAITRCVKPANKEPVRSLMVSAGRASSPWNMHQLELQTQFLGAESQAGHALFSRHHIVVQTRQEKERLFPHHCLPKEESSMTCPILIADRAAGSLSIVSTQPHFFTQPSIDLIQNYVDLLALAFEPANYYDLSTIELGIMPPREQQQEILKSFQKRVTQQIIRATQTGNTITRPEAELIVWREIEQELLHHSSWTA
ncbi:hypothetical protein ccbrp13_51730 [Ktedonobacteria bacterium brp13]|nr:hypothetical protein ccbrp13_51730 [Ktedonobacteria bacterium brp13]